MADAPQDKDKEAEGETRKGRVNLIVGGVVAVMVAVIGAGIFFSFQFVENERQRALNEWQIRLGIVADSRVADINEWTEFNLGTIAELTENASLQLYMSELSEAQNDKSGVTDATAQQGYLRNLLIAVADRNGFAPPPPQQEVNSNIERAGTAGMALLDSDGKPIVITPGMPSLSGKQRGAIAKSFDGMPAIIDMYKGATNQPTMGFSLPVYGVQQDPGSKGLGIALGIRVIDDELYDLLKQPGDTSKTSETFLVRKTGGTVEYLSPLKDGAKALERTMALDTPNLAAAFALEKPGGFAIMRDYSGEEVLVTSRPIADLPWVLVRKISRAEALSANESRLQTILVVFVLIIVGVAISMIAIWRHGTSLRAAAAAEKFRISSERFENISKFMRVITNSQATHIVAVDGTTSYTFSNEPAATAAGIKAEEMFGKTMAGVMGPVKAKYYAEINKQMLADFAEVEEQGVEDSVQKIRASNIQRFEQEDGNLQVIRADHIPLRGDRDHPPGILMIMDDITEFSQEQIKSETRLRQLVSTLAAIVDQHDTTSTARSNHISEVARAIAEDMGSSKIETDTAEFAGALLNLGTIIDPKNVIESSCELLANIDFEGPVVEAIRQSFEADDGSGPNGLAGEQIILPARIVAVAHAFLNLCDPENGSAGTSIEAAGNTLLEESGTKYDRAVVAALLNLLENHGGAKKWAHFLPAG